MFPPGRQQEQDRQPVGYPYQFFHWVSLKAHPVLASAIEPFPLCCVGTVLGKGCLYCQLSSLHLWFPLEIMLCFASFPKNLYSTALWKQSSSVVEVANFSRCKDSCTTVISGILNYRNIPVSQCPHCIIFSSSSLCFQLFSFYLIFTL